MTNYSDGMNMTESDYSKIFKKIMKDPQKRDFMIALSKLNRKKKIAMLFDMLQLFLCQQNKKCNIKDTH